MKLTPNTIVWILLAVLTVSLIISIRSCDSHKRSQKESVSLINALNDSLTLRHNKQGQEIAKSMVIESVSPELLLQLKSADHKIIALQELIKKNMKDLSAATILSTETSVDTKTPTKVIGQAIVRDTVYPIYQSDINKGGWIVGSVVASKDSTTTNLSIINDYDIIVKRDKGVPYAEVTNKNPYTATKTLKTFNVSVPKPKRFGISPVVGYGFTGSGKLQPFVGLGLSYDIIQF